MTAITFLHLSLFPVYAATDGDLNNKSQSTPIPTGRYWVFLEQDNLSQEQLDQALNETAAGMTERSLARRRKCIGRDPPVRPCDLQVNSDRAAAIESTGCRIVRSLRYINAVTVTGSQAALNEVRKLDFVRELRPVMSYPCITRTGDEYSEPEQPESHLNAQHTADAETYGRSWDQCRQVNVPDAHERGYRGSGVLIGVQDTGFDNLDHGAFQHLNVLAAYDFVNNDNNVADHGDHGSGRHGTRTLSVIAGLDSGNFIGIAPDAQYVLTKTENSESETRIEEDYWVAGLWFHDSLGVDVLSSSLSYRAWYDWEDMDGSTAVTSRAADSAAAAGLVIVSSTGNTGRSRYPDSKIGAPADARGVIAVGAVRRDSSYWNVSSRGPTYDGRIKPNAAALGYAVYAASNYNDTTYSTHNGTSFSCPIVAGIAALTLEANPWLTPSQVMRILQSSSHQADNPDTLIGYGIPDALAAVREAEAEVISSRINLPQDFQFTIYPNPFNDRLNVRFNGYQQPYAVQVYDLTGRRLDISHAVTSSQIALDFSGYSSGTYVLRVAGRESQKSKIISLIK